MFTRSDERETSEAYRRLWRDQRPGMLCQRFLMGPVGTFLLNTPLFLLQRRLGISSRHRLLEIGCGRGAGLRVLAARIPFQRPPVGIDLAPAALELAQRDGSAGSPMVLLAVAATRLPFARESFDLILSTHMVKHLSDAAIHRFFFESWRALRPGGVLIVWEFAPTRSRLLNRFHRWLLTADVKTCRLRGYGDFVDLAIESRFMNMENLTLRPYLFPPIPRTGFLLKKAADVEPAEQGAEVPAQASGNRLEP
ncbi:MAG: class I SAM-dependent methyltransferase [Dehalococcoidia bacterium]